MTTTRQREPSRRTVIHMSALLAATSLVPSMAAAQGYPDRAVKLTVGFAPGTGPDILARTLGQKLGDVQKQSLVVDNRAGAGGQIAAQIVAKSAADGYTLLIADVSAISIAPAAFAQLPYNPTKELIAVSEVARTDFLLVVPTTSTARTLADLVKTAKASANKINFATFGAGTPGHFGAEMLAEQAGFKVEPIHFRATGDAVTAIIAGDVQAALVSTALGVAQIKGGKMRALATTAPTRSPLVPDVPTFIESGFPKADFSAWFAIFVPTGTPASVIATLNTQLVTAVQSPEVRQKLEEAGFSVLGSSQADVTRMVAGEAVRWAGVVKATGFKGD